MLCLYCGFRHTILVHYKYYYYKKKIYQPKFTREVFESHLAKSFRTKVPLKFVLRFVSMHVLWTWPQISVLLMPVWTAQITGSDLGLVGVASYLKMPLAASCLMKHNWAKRNQAYLFSAVTFLSLSFTGAYLVCVSGKAHVTKRELIFSCLFLIVVS